jgi:hypothetical protein
LKAYLLPINQSSINSSTSRQSTINSSSDGDQDILFRPPSRCAPRPSTFSLTATSSLTYHSDQHHQQKGKRGIKPSAINLEAKEERKMTLKLPVLCRHEYILLCPP